MTTEKEGVSASQMNKDTAECQAKADASMAMDAYWLPARCMLEKGYQVQINGREFVIGKDGKMQAINLERAK